MEDILKSNISHTRSEKRDTTSQTDYQKITWQIEKVCGHQVQSVLEMRTFHFVVAVSCCGTQDAQNYILAGGLRNLLWTKILRNSSAFYWRFFFFLFYDSALLLIHVVFRLRIISPIAVKKFTNYWKTTSREGFGRSTGTPALPKMSGVCLYWLVNQKVGELSILTLIEISLLL